MKVSFGFTVFLGAASALLAACGAESVARKPSATARPPYAGTCVLAGIEQVPAPVDQAEDAVVLVARYRPSAGGTRAGQPWSLRFQVARARAHDLRLHVEAHPSVLCEVDHHKGVAGSERIDLPPFEGQHGEFDL